MDRQTLKDLTPPLAWRLVSNLRTAGHTFRSREAAADAPLQLGESILQSKSATVRGIFMHIHKCAGTSLIDAFETRPEVVSCVARPGNFPRRTGRERIPDKMWRNSVKFTFVRNPYDRVVSAYKMFIKTPVWRSLFPRFEDFVEFLRWADVDRHRVEEETPVDDYVLTIGNLIHHCSAYHNPKYMLDEMDHIGRLETIDDDLVKISAMLDTALPGIPRLNKSKGNRHYHDYYNGKTRRLVHDLYRADIERFEYEF